MTLKEIKRALKTALKRKYPDHKIYGADTVEGYVRPSFFVYITQTFSETSKNAVHKNVEVEIDLIQKTPDEAGAMDFFDTMNHLFCQKLDTGERKLNTSNLYSDFQGENQNIPYFGFELEFWDAIEKETDNTPLMGDVTLRQEVKR